MNKVILVDDHYIMRRGLQFSLSTIENIEVLQDFVNGETFLEYLKKYEHSDIVLLDLMVPGMNGIEITEYTKVHYPDIKVLVLASYVDDEHAISTISKGADGYEMKDAEPQQLIETTRRAMNGEEIIYPEVQDVFETISQKPHYTNKSSKREIKVLCEMVKGKTNEKIVRTLFTSEKTIKTHVSRVFSKLQVSDRTQTTTYAMENKLIQNEPLNTCRKIDNFQPDLDGSFIATGFIIQFSL